MKQKKGSRSFVFFLTLCMVVFAALFSPQNSSAYFPGGKARFPYFIKVASLIPSLPQKTYKAPTPEIEALANEATMTDYAKQIFYSAQPEIDTDRATFDKNCQVPDATDAIELGCFTVNNHIYILDIQNPKLRDEMVATASHEMLHAAYEKLSSGDRATINQELEAVVPDLSDTDLPKELQNYQISEPGERDNELHSLLGTEYSNLSPELEKYYSKYFSNRQAVVQNYQSFNGVFDTLEKQLSDLEIRIKGIRITMMADLRDGKISEYNSLIPTENDLIHQYNEGVLQYNQLSRSLLGDESPVQGQ